MIPPWSGMKIGRDFKSRPILFNDPKGIVDIAVNASRFQRTCNLVCLTPKLCVGKPDNELASWNLLRAMRWLLARFAHPHTDARRRQIAYLAEIISMRTRRDAADANLAARYYHQPGLSVNDQPLIRRRATAD